MDAAITVRVEWEMGHRLPNHDGACRNLHGHHYIAEATIRGPIRQVHGSPDEGMVQDFSALKSQLRALVFDLDHRFLLYEYDLLVPLIANTPGIVLVPYIPTAENIATFLLSQLPQVESILLYETPTSYVVVSR